MAPGEPLMCLLLLALCCGTSHQAYMKPPSRRDPEFIQKCVNDHNRARAQVSPSASNMRHMTWDPALATVAQAWADQCAFGHNPDIKTPNKVHPTFATVGENIWLGSSHSQISPVQLWVAEDKHYNYESNTCSAICGHYTQVNWAETYKVGCAAQFCPQVTNYPGASDLIILVCNYGPAGNYPRKPYSAGQPCSQCSRGDKCRGALCVNAERDGVEGHDAPGSGAGAALPQSGACFALRDLALLCACAHALNGAL
ncbi:glioma pathogenesis-related protein 1-like [Ambystoma mexicanum]|uniref:glioma pathogenesis-related protein 1-like n=1 Tax=Ambystoma mexicanum TaxID=8296 RepID=UPI0037E7A74B